MFARKKQLFLYFLALLCLAGIVLQDIHEVQRATKPLGFDDWVQLAAWGFLIPVVFTVLSILILARQPDNRIGWALMVVALAAANPLGGCLADIVVPPDTLSFWFLLLLVFDTWSWVPVIFPVLLLPLYFPTGRAVSSRWNWVTTLAMALAIGFFFLILIAEKVGPLDGGWLVSNPIGVIPQDFLDGPFLVAWGIGLVTVAGSSVVSLIVRYRRSSFTGRQQIKWLIYGGVVFVIFYGLVFFLSPANEFGASPWLNLSLSLAILSLPAAIGIAILRYKVYDIDLIIRRTLQYSALTGVLALTYFGAIVVLQGFFGSVTGESSSPLATVISTLAIAALFSPLRSRIQAWIDRRFYRAKYDAEQALGRFAVTARDEVDLDRLAFALVEVVSETLQPDRLSCLLRPTRRRSANEKESA